MDVARVAGGHSRARRRSRPTATGPNSAFAVTVVRNETNTSSAATLGRNWPPIASARARVVASMLNWTPPSFFSPAVCPNAGNAAIAQKPMSAARNRGEGKVEVKAYSGNKRLIFFIGATAGPLGAATNRFLAGMRKNGLSPRRCAPVDPEKSLGMYLPGRTPGPGHPL